MIVRAAEIKQLQAIYENQGNHLVVVSGRDTSDKEGILKTFIKGKKCFYFHARNASSLEQFRQMKSEAVLEFEGADNATNYDELLSYIKSDDDSKLVFVVDEAQNLKKENEKFWQAVGKLKSGKLNGGSVLIIIYTSSLVWANEGLMETFDTLYKRVDSFIRLENIKFLDIVRAFPEDFKTVDAIKVYATFGGSADYLNRYDVNLDFKTNVCNLILSNYGPLFSEAERFIGSELRELAVYDTILSAIAAGNRKLNDLYHITGFSRAKISVYLKNLAEFNVVEKAQSIETGGWENAQKGLYQIKDTFVNFWFKFIYPNLSKLYTLSPEEFYDKYIAPELDEYVNRYFVSVCLEYLMLLDKIDKLPITLKRYGTWIGKQGTIDVVAMDDARNAIVGICNWTEEFMRPAKVRELAETLKKAKISPLKIYLFSATDFSPELKTIANASENFELVDMKEL